MKASFKTLTDTDEVTGEKLVFHKNSYDYIGSYSGEYTKARLSRKEKKEPEEEIKIAWGNKRLIEHVSMKCEELEDSLESNTEPIEQKNVYGYNGIAKAILNKTAEEKEFAKKKLKERVRKQKELSYYKKIYDYFVQNWRARIVNSDYKEIEKILDVAKYSTEVEKRKKNLTDKEKRKIQKEDYFFYLNSDIEIESYIDDFALLVIYAKNRCFKKYEAYSAERDSVLSEKTKRDIGNFYARMAKEEIDVEIDEIIIKGTITEKNEKGEIDISINAPILMKIMLYEFAKTYFTFIEGEDDEIWESNIPFYDTDKRGRDALVDKHRKIALINVYRSFIDKEKLFRDKTPMNIKDLLLGRLLSIIEPDLKFENKATTFTKEANYYSHEIQSILRVDQKRYPKKKSEKTKPK